MATYLPWEDKREASSYPSLPLRSDDTQPVYPQWLFLGSAFQEALGEKPTTY